MSGRDEKYTDEQRGAIVAAIIDDRLTPADAVARAKRGDLGVPAFEMPKSTASALGTAERRRRGSVGRSDALIRLDRMGETLIDSAIAVATEERDRLAKKREEGQALETADLTRLGKVAWLLKEVRKLATEVRTPPPLDDDLGDDPTDVSPLASALLTEIQEMQATAEGNGSRNGA